MKLKQICKTVPARIIISLVFMAFGIAVGYLFWKTSCQQLDFGSPLANQLIKWLIIGSFALGCAATPTVRCVVLITLTTVINLDGQSIIQCALMAKLADTAGQNLIINFQRATNSVLCNIDVAKNITKAKVDLMEKPTQDVMDDLLQGVDSSSNVGRHMPDLVNRLENELGKLAKGGEVEEMEERAAYVDEQERQIRRKKKHESDEQLKKRFEERNHKQYHKVNKLREGMLREFINKSTYRCNDIVNGAVFLCKEWFDRKLEECIQSAWWEVLCIMYEFDWLCTFFEVLNFRFEECGSEKTEIDKYAEQYGNQLALADQWTQDLASEFLVNIQYKVDFPFHQPNLVTLQQMLVIVREAFSGVTQLLRYLSTFLSSIGFVFILMALRTNYKWFKTFQEDISHENVYLTPTWWLIDRRRRKENRTTLRPLRPFEKKRLHNPLTLKPNAIEQKQLFRGLGKLINLLIVSVSLIVVDTQFYNMMMLAAQHSGIEVIQEGRHDLTVNVQGTGAVAKMVSSIVQDVDKTYQLDQNITNHHCMAIPSKADQKEIRWIWIYFAILLVQSTAGIYLVRLRVLIASLVFPQRQRVRNVWLYNDMLRQRALFNRQRKININRMAMGGEEFPKRTWLDSILNRCKCLWCGRTEAEKVRTCKEHDRTVFFCKDCWQEEMNGTCAACTLSTENVLDGEGRIKEEYRHMGIERKKKVDVNADGSDSKKPEADAAPDQHN
uniref:DC_STAMP domain-containing protein n=1 Tax=Trichuris muris TaxID=70415 RepID=A0A5S6R1I5_TRIMR